MQQHQHLFSIISMRTNCVELNYIKIYTDYRHQCSKEGEEVIVRFGEV